jgi:nucleotide-binding universal stress UspA family protein
MRVLVWVTEGGWEACVAAARELDATELTVLHVLSEEPEAAATGALAGLLGRHPPRHPQRSVARLSREAAEALVADAATRLGRDARRIVATGRVERVVTDAARAADLLVVARDTREPGPKSIRHPTRFVVDHAPCPLLLVWPGPPDLSAGPPRGPGRHGPPGQRGR